MDPAQYRTVAGASFVAGGAVSILGIITAETQFPGYSTADRTISALGSSAGTPGSRAAFNGAMVVAGLLVLVAAYGLHRADGDRPLTAVLVVTGLGGLIGVGLFPAQTGLPHLVASLLTFGGLGVTALVVAGLVQGPFRGVSAVLGALELLALVLYVVLGGGTFLGVGGLERWVAYLALVWAVSFGGFLLAGDAGRARGRRLL